MTGFENHDVHYYQTYEQTAGLGDQVGTALAQAATSLFGGVIERLDPGAAPGVRATVRGVNDNMQAQLRRAPVTVLRTETVSTPVDYWEYRAEGTPQVQNPYNS